MNQQILLQQQQLQQSQLRPLASGGSQPKQRVFTGTVTKMHENFGFVDEDVFFQLSSCEGKIPIVGDTVFVEALFNPNMPFKWNATRVQNLGPSQNQAFSYQGNSLNPGRSQQPNVYSSQHLAQPQGLNFTSVHGGAGLLGPAPVNVINTHMNQPRHQKVSGGGGKVMKRNQNRMGGRGRHSPPPRARVKSRSPEDRPRRKRSRTPPPRKRSPSPMRRRRSISSEKTSRHSTPRYMIKFTKNDLTRKSSDVLQVRNSCPNLYVPSDFMKVSYKWFESFPLDQNLKIDKCHFHVFSKEAEPIVKVDQEMLNPPDSDHTWNARVMLLQTPGMKELYKQCCGLAEESSHISVHASRLYQFLLGYKSKKEPMAIGGSWSPSLDGPNPSHNPLTLVKTAIRCCKALVGIDLSKCTEWHRILEVHYMRQAEIRKGVERPDRVETTVIFLPNIHSCMPNSTEYAALCTSYLEKMNSLIGAAQNSEKDDAVKTDQTNGSARDTQADSDTAADQIEQKMEETTEKVSAEASEESLNDSEIANVSTDDGETPVTPTHHSELDIKALKVDLLRKELSARGLNTKGLKGVLVTRLKNAVKQEAEEEKDNDEKPKEDSDADVDKNQRNETEPMECNQGEADVKEKETVEKQENQLDKEDETKTDQEKKETEKERENFEKKDVEKKKVDTQHLKRIYTLPESRPLIPVHPSPVYRHGKFDCSTASLATLLSYRQDDNKESIFEVSLFAEAFNEMLQRRFAYNIYRALANPTEFKPEKEEKSKEEKEQNDGLEQDKKEDLKRKTKEDSEEPKEKKVKNSEDKVEKDGEDKVEKTKDKSDDDEKAQKRSASSDRKRDDKTSRERETKGEKSKRSIKSSEKMVSVRQELLFSFVYFDQSHCGYIHEADLIDIIHSIGLELSRSQITKLVTKFTERGNLHYRKLTDVPASRVDAFKEMLAKSEDSDSFNHNLMSTEVVEDSKEEIPELTKGVVIYKGAIVDVGSLQKKLGNSERNIEELQENLEKQTRKLESANKHLTKSQKDHEQVTKDYEATKKKLSETQANLKNAIETKSKLEKSLRSVKLTVDSVLPKTESKE